MTNETRKLISDYLEGKLTSQERARLETWYLTKAEQADDIVTTTEYEVKAAKLWQQIEKGIIRQPIEAKKPKHITLFRPYVVKLTIAATLLIVATATFLLLKGNANANRFVIAKNKDIAPGINKAYLTLSDGHKIDLSDASTGNIATEAGLQVSKTEDGTLFYKALGTSTGKTGFNQISTPLGGQYAVILPDGSKVWLNAGSSLSYPVAFKDSGRIVTLSGEGYFEVAHIEGKSGRLPFTVNVHHNNGQQELVKVLGTHFNINAYEDEPTIKTTLLQGSVRVETKNGQTALLVPGQQANLNKNKLDIQTADTEMAVAWKNGDFVFREDLRSAMRKVAKWYNVEVVYDSSAPANLMLGGWMSRNRNISEVLDHIQLTGKVHFKLEGRRVTVFK